MRLFYFAFLAKTFRMVSVSAMFGLFKQQSNGVGFANNPKADAALRRATELKQAGRINEAIEELGNFHLHAEAGNASYPVESFLRLPMYLQAAGRREEAWEQFYKLLKEGYPKQLTDAGVRLAEKSAIYDKMRLFLQRDKNPLLAAHFGVLCYAAWLAALFKQSRMDELVKEQSPEKMRLKLGSLLAKAKRFDLQEFLVNALLQFIQRGYDLKFIEAESRRLTEESSV